MRASTLRGWAIGLCVTAPWLMAADGCRPAPPDRPVVGPGSPEGYIATSIERFESGEITADDSTKVTWFVPDKLAGGASAPVIVYLHGFQAGNPSLYQQHIDHIALQGNIVVFPRFNSSNPFRDLDQNAMVDRIVRNSLAALDAVGSRADLGALYVYGHSAGAAFGSVWEHNGGPSARGSVLAHPSVGSDAIPVPIEIVEVDFEVEAGATRGPVVLLTGDADTIAVPAEAVELHGYLTGASSRQVWQALADDHGMPALTAGHTDPLALESGDADTLDWRFYWSALDQMMADVSEPSFDLGTWSDGTPVAAPVRLAD